VEARAALARRAVFVLTPLVAALVAIGIWQFVVAATGVSADILPSPGRVLNMAWRYRDDLWLNTVPTLEETLLGLAVTISAAALFATVTDFSVWARRIIYPLLVASQTIPIMIIAPLMVIWFGFGLFPKLLVIVLVSFFPITVALMDGFNSTEPEAANLLRSMGANRVQEFLKVRVPTALPYFFTGLRISVAWSVVAAIFSEYVGAEQGLGIYMQIQKNDFRTDLVLAAVLVTSLASVALFALTYIVQIVTIPWYSKSKRGQGASRP